MEAAFKRHSFIKGLHGDKKEKEKEREKEKESRTPGSNSPQPIRMNIRMESPPILFLGPHSEHSAGFLMSGQLVIEAMGANMTIQKLDLELRGTQIYKKPLMDRCPDCNTVHNSLRTWKILAQPRTLAQGTQSFPFSDVLPDHFPATTRGNLGILTYALIAGATLSSGEILTYTHPLEMKRALAPSKEPKHFKRIFPPTKLIAEAYFPPTIHPIGDFNIEFRLSGLTTLNGDGSVLRSKLRRFMYRIEQHESILPHACPSHNHKLHTSTNKDKDKSLKPHIETRVIGSGELKSGWKTDFAARIPSPHSSISSTTSPSGESISIGTSELQTSAHINTNLRPSCTLPFTPSPPSSPTSPSSPTTSYPQSSFHISHTLTIELVIEDEWTATTNPNAPATPTGAARVLKMTYEVTVTERAGLGISWDEEQPPTYEDVPPSPPRYWGDREMGGLGLEGLEGRDWDWDELGPPRGEPPGGGGGDGG
ncbi:MAG: hypothetical protein M1820_008386 [Bogoriella megaspora]|nr:MAG: hypothetical protein M1820_008386 [Bogoriella megaspora]